MSSLNKYRIFDAFYKMQGKLIPLLHGNPGMGKTSSAVAFATSNNIPYYYLPANKCGIDQLSGIPIKNKDDKLVTSPPEFVGWATKNPDGILIIDELSTADVDKQRLLLSIILDCKGVGWSFPNTVRRFCMTNDSTECTGNNELISALNDRVCHLWEDPNFDEASKARQSGYLLKPQAKIKSTDEAKTSHVYNQQFIIDFINSRPKYKERFGNMTRIEGIDETDHMKITSYLSERTQSNLESVLDYMSDMITLPANPDQNLESGLEFIKHIISGYAGEDFALDLCKEYVAKESQRFVFDPKKYLGSEDKFKIESVIDPNRNDRVALLVRSMWLYFNEDPKKYAKLWIKILNATYNNNHTYGNFDQYKSYSMMYVHDTIQILIKVSDNPDLSKFHDVFDAYKYGDDTVKAIIAM